MRALCTENVLVGCTDVLEFNISPGRPGTRGIKAPDLSTLEWSQILERLQPSNGTERGLQCGPTFHQFEQRRVGYEHNVQRYSHLCATDMPSKCHSHGNDNGCHCGTEKIKDNIEPPLKTQEEEFRTLEVFDL